MAHQRAHGETQQDARTHPFRAEANQLASTSTFTTRSTAAVAAAGGSSLIPKVLFLTYKSPLSERTWRKFEAAAPGYTIEFYNDSRADAFVAQYCELRFVERFRRLRGAHRADMLRYLLLYQVRALHANQHTYHPHARHQMHSGYTVLSNWRDLRSLQTRAAQPDTCVVSSRIVWWGVLGHRRGAAQAAR